MTLTNCLTRKLLDTIPFLEMAVELASDELATALAAFSAGAARPERADRAAADDCSVAVLLELMNCAPSRLTERAVCAEVVALPRCTLVIEQAPGLSTEGAGTTGGVLWGTALAAAHLLCSARDAFWSRRRTVLELGSGTGVLGLAAAARGCDVTLTDQRALLPLLRRNAEANARVIAAAGGRARAAELDWSRAESAALAAALAPDLVLCSDLVYGNDYLPLLGLLDELASRASKPLDILWGFEERSDRYPSPGLAEALERRFDVRPCALPDELARRYPRTHLAWLAKPARVR